MALLEPYWLAEMHREVYVAMLKSWIPHGQKGEFARRAGLSRVHLGYLCALNHPAEERSPMRRLPSPSMAEQIAKALPAPAEIKHSLVEHMALAHINAVKAHYVTRAHIAQRRVAELLTELDHLHRQATFGSDVTQTTRAYRAVCDASGDLLTQLSPAIYPAAYAQTCLYLHDAQCVLDRADDALRYAKLARLVLEASDFFEISFTREQVDNLKINAIRGEAVAYHNLGLYREVRPLCEQAEATPACRNASDFWKPLVGRDLLNALARTPRFSIRASQQIARTLETICERKGDSFTLFLVRESWLRCLVQHAEWKQAERVLQKETDLLPHLPYVGPLHRALVLKTGAHLAWQRGDRTTWQQSIRTFWELASRAGLKHQCREVRELYSSALQPIVDELASNL